MPYKGSLPGKRVFFGGLCCREMGLLACIQKENRNTVAYDCRDVVIILTQLEFKKSQSTNTFNNERKTVFEPMFVLERQRKDKSKSWCFRPLATFIASTWRHWFLAYLAVYILRVRNNKELYVANRYSPISCIKDKSIATCADVTQLL